MQMLVRSYKRPAKNAVQLHPFLSTQEEINVPSETETILRMKTIRPIVSEHSIIASFMHGNSAPAAADPSVIF